VPTSFLRYMCRATAARIRHQIRQIVPIFGTEQRTSTNVVPIRVVGGKFLEGASLDDIDPGWHLKLARPLEVGGVGGNEIFCATSQIRSAAFQEHFQAYKPDVAYARHRGVGGIASFERC
jgi:hypothetical protein